MLSKKTHCVGVKAPFHGAGSALFAPTYTGSYHHLIWGLLLTLNYIFMWNTWPQANMPYKFCNYSLQFIRGRKAK